MDKPRSGTKAPPSDRRMRKTKAILRQSLSQLLMQKSLKDITVSELAELADVNRGTFYLHYKDVYDLFEQMESDIYEHFKNILEKQKKIQIKWYPLLLDIFRYIHDNAETIRAILQTPESTVLSRIIEQNRPQGRDEWVQLLGDKSEPACEYYYSFIVSGCVAVIRRWLTEGMAEPPESVAAFTERMMVSCIRGLS